MIKFLKSKKGFTDIFIAAIILSIFFFTALLIEPINQSFDADLDTFDTDNLAQNVRNRGDSISILNTGSLLSNILKLAFWDIGGTLNLNFVIQGFFSLLGIILFVIVVRTVRGVG